MSLISLPFFLLTAATVLLYYTLPKHSQWVILLIASLAFYATYGLAQFFPMLLAAVSAYLAAKWIQEIYDAEEGGAAAERKAKCKGNLLFAVTVLVLLLIYAKLGNWVLQGLAGLLSLNGDAMQAIVALGVSYYTFSLISYVADVYWRKDRAETNFLRLLLFVLYFPKILQGPISRHKNLAPQLVQPHKFDYREFCFGLQLMVWGYFKKMVVADRLAIFVNTVFGNAENASGSHLLAASCFGAVQLYCDFSGCMDIAGGFSQMLGLNLEPNFDHPFFSRSAAEFWRRWHITLGTWFKDYVYMPLVISPRLIKLSKGVRDRFGPRAGKAVMTVLPLLAVWLLTGLWHNAGWSYVAWGLYWGGVIICSTVFAPELKRLTAALRINTETGSWRIFQMVRTFLLFVVSRIITIPGDLRVSWQVFRSIALNFHVENLVDGSLYTLGLDRPNFILAVVCMFVLWSAGMLQERGCVRERLAGSNIVFRWSAYYLLFFAIIIFGVYGPGYEASSFAYMKF